MQTVLEDAVAQRPRRMRHAIGRPLQRAGDLKAQHDDARVAFGQRSRRPATAGRKDDGADRGPLGRVGVTLPVEHGVEHFEDEVGVAPIALGKLSRGLDRAHESGGAVARDPASGASEAHASAAACFPEPG